MSGARLVLGGMVLTLSLAAGAPAWSDSAGATHRPTGQLPSTGQLLSTGQRLTPTAAPGSRFLTLNPGLPDAPDYVVGQTVSEALSPDRRTLLVLTSGYNRRKDAHGRPIASDSDEYVFVFDVSDGTSVQRQVLHVPNTYVGIDFSPDGTRFAVSGGRDDCLHVFERSAGGWRESPFSPIALDHTLGLGLGQQPLAQGVAVSRDGALAAVTNRYNASLSLVDLRAGRRLRDIDLRPGAADPRLAGVPGGTYPAAARFDAEGKVWVSSERDRELVAVDVTGSVRVRLSLDGNPGKLIANRAGTRLYVALDNADAVAVVDTATGRLVTEIPVVAPPGVLGLERRYRGASPNAMALSDDERTLYVTDRGTNAVAVVSLAGAGEVIGLIPTGWYPSDVVVGPHQRLYVVNTKSMPGPNPGNCLGYERVPCPVQGSPVRFAPNQYILSLAKGGLLSLPIPRGRTLDALTQQVARNDGFGRARHAEATMRAVRARVKHLIYIVKENRTYDQVLGDLRQGNGDARLAEFPRSTTPNQHALAEQFVLFDAFYDAGDVSGDGWPWSTSARESDAGAKMLPVDYAKRGGSYDWEGTNSNVNVALEGEQRLAAEPLLADPRTGALNADVLAGTADVAAPDGPQGEPQQGYLWDAALRAGLSVRNYGFFIDLTRYGHKLRETPAGAAAYLPLEREPAARSLTVAVAANRALLPLTDPYFRGFDTAYPDFWREREWEREFHRFLDRNELPALSLVRFMNDHTGSYADAIDGVNTPERQVADNDYAVGRLVEAVARSPRARDTLIVIVEDDAQDGPDHVDAHRSIAFLIGACVRHHARVSHPYNTVNLLRTVTEVLGIDHLGLLDATEQPMSEAFDARCPDWSYRATVSGLLEARDVTLPIPTDAPVVGPVRAPTHPAAYWAARTRDMDFDAEDRLDAGRFNRLLWEGLMDRTYPSARAQRDAD